MEAKSETRIDPHDLDMVAFNSNKKIRARNAVLAVDAAMQENYTILKSELIEHLSPVIVVQNDGQGGTFTLVYQGTQESVQPVPQLFQLVKSVSHTPLGIYVIIAPYLKEPHVKDWIKPLEKFKETLQEALKNLPDAELPFHAQESCKKVLEGGIRFIDDSVKADRFSIDSFEAFTASVQSDIQTNMSYAAKAQVDGVEELLIRWRNKLGPEEWRKTYGIVLAIWTTEYLNQNWLILNHMMDPTTVDSHLFTIGIASFAENTVPVALDNLARIVQDNIAAAMVFSEDSELADSLKGPQDLLSTAIEKIIGCPHTTTKKAK
ncbi:hypothetical protein [Flavobacterium sp. PS2]|jgi:hypothetical protein|uniref:hypothetical protein n=1 Tax=Flavobacterium sp. PS2 TaxID=3384157 RepID=UPI00390CAB41